MTDTSNNGWNYRVIEFSSVESQETWRSICEVHYRDSVPVAYAETPAGVNWYPDAGDNDDTPFSILDRMREALTKPVLIASDFLT